jgi:hypothetical protein
VFLAEGPQKRGDPSRLSGLHKACPVGFSVRRNGDGERHNRGVWTTLRGCRTYDIKQLPPPLPLTKQARPAKSRDVSSIHAIALSFRPRGMSSLQGLHGARGFGSSTPHPVPDPAAARFKSSPNPGLILQKHGFHCSRHDCFNFECAHARSYPRPPFCNAARHTARNRLAGL